MSRPQHFAWFLSRGFGPQAWGQPNWDWDRSWTEPELYRQSARELEQAGFDLVIIEDALSLGNASTLDLRVRRAYGGPKHDPMMLAPYLFEATQTLGVAPTVNPMAYSPYQAARQFATLQHLSGGRLGLNVVTDVGSSRHFGFEPLAHDAAYDRAHEWLDSIRELWHSWDDGALIRDAASGRFADGTRLRPVRHRGAHFVFDGPLNALPFEGGDPVIVSPGGSPRGIDFAGAQSEIQLALASLDTATVRSYRERARAAAAAHGRDPDDLTILFVVKPVVVSSREEAERLVAASAHPDEEALLAIAAAQSSDLETDLTALDLDRPIDPSVFGEHVSRGSIAGLYGGADADAPLRELLTAKARLGLIADRRGVVGTAEEVADFVQELGDDADNDGIAFSGDFHPVTLHRMLDDLVPILRRRGILRRDHPGGGLRGSLARF
ncbi:FMN-dependent oxidoreductase, nitrilotriacetate monooxygenase family [Rathayibacter oskolensis]|uniref:FMN-dependent oxidoreductase, nitrilotriacetate monooxygenase family n=1 Tax=Rathayibacter oskolensis TaxID=1891671 RepID=A0A1X7NM78_9MICO|nr:NtaA/DmoA family FMN-dependent monooxygenase [Rathayibacter oskolensis]SMH39081.1 FMN-dependent oxidoreductase, nitrilotriacetate monooxygenase family [Rathayibacter oskolensis]